MAKNKLNSGTTKGQRIAIWAILVLTVVSTIALYAASFLSTQNQAKDAAKAQEQYAKYQKAVEEYQKKVEAQGKELSAKYYDSFKEFEKYPTNFNAANVKEVTKSDIREGDGEKISDATEYSAYYIGWMPNGTVFDGSFGASELKSPLTISGASSMIEGWTEGLKDMKIGGVREIAIPAAKAYGEAGSTNSQDASKSIPANTPIKFVVMTIPKVAEIPQPNYEELLK